MENFKNTSHGFNFSFDRSIPAKSEVIIKMPTVSANKRGINDIGFAVEDGITLYATLAAKPSENSTIWQEIQPFDEINKTTAYIKAVNSADSEKRVNIRVILN